MTNEQRTLTQGDRVECLVFTADGWCKGVVVSARDTNFDVKFEPPAGRAKVGYGLFHHEHQGENWRFDPDPPPEAEAASAPQADDVPEAAAPEESPPDA